MWKSVCPLNSLTKFILRSQELLSYVSLFFLLAYPFLSLPFFLSLSLFQICTSFSMFFFRTVSLFSKNRLHSPLYGHFTWLKTTALSFTPPSSHTKNTFRSSIFHLLECISLIVRCIDWWKMRFLCHLSSTPIFHLPPAVLGDISVVTVWKTNGYVQFLIRLSL